MKKQFLLLPCLAFLACTSLHSPVHAEGVLEASSSASVDAGFPVITGPGTTVLGPNGSYTTPLAPKMTEQREPFVAPTPKVQVRNYSWPKSRRPVRQLQSRSSGTRPAVAPYNTVNIIPEK